MFYGEESFKTVNFGGSVVTEVISHEVTLLIYGELAENNPCKYFVFEFHCGTGRIDGIESIKTIENISITESEKGHDIKLNDFSFSCHTLFCFIEKYKGFSYENVYDEHRKYIESIMYIENEKYFFEEEEYELPDGFSEHRISYVEECQNEKGVPYKKRLLKCTIKNGGNAIYEYYADSHMSRPFKKFIYHSNGHRYYPFKVGLYGISYIDVDTLEVYNYIPEGCSHDYLSMTGESFIITNIHYDKGSDLIIYEGGYWCGGDELMVGDFSNPLDFNPYLVRLRDIFDIYSNNENEDDDVYLEDVYFLKCENGRLYIQLLYDDSTKKEEYISIDELKEMINKLTKEKSK